MNTEHIFTCVSNDKQSQRFADNRGIVSKSFRKEALLGRTVVISAQKGKP